MDRDVKIDGSIVAQAEKSDTCIIGALFLSLGTEPLVGGGDGVPIDLDKFLMLDDPCVFAHVPETDAVDLTVGEP